MDAYKLLGHIAREIDKIRVDQVTVLTSGRAADHPEYRHICGVIRGLSLADNIINDLVHKLEKYEDE
jgi:hypothetical protein